MNNLVLANCHVATECVVRSIAETCFQLVDLDLSNCHITDTGSFCVLAQLKKLIALNLYRTNVTNPELKAIIASNQVQTLIFEQFMN